jgi:hypothetical protein
MQNIEGTGCVETVEQPGRADAARTTAHVEDVDTHPTPATRLRLLSERYDHHVVLSRQPPDAFDQVGNVPSPVWAIHPARDDVPDPHGRRPGGVVTRSA